MQDRFRLLIFSFCMTLVACTDNRVGSRAPPTSGALQISRQALEPQAQAIVQQFAGRLKPALISAIAEGGPVHAIDVCAETAPGIARDLSAQFGWNVKRVSLKPRNTGTARPDDWAKEVLTNFDTRTAQGESPQVLVASEIVGDEFRFMKAQPTGPLCLTCHGKSIDPAVQAAIDARYPNDQARGYVEGEIRGGFYLTRQLGQSTPVTTQRTP
ncbi:MAG: DUF3365 domain-containing protein [Pseudomonadales bacterium]